MEPPFLAGGTGFPSEERAAPEGMRSVTINPWNCLLFLDGPLLMALEWMLLCFFEARCVSLLHADERSTGCEPCDARMRQITQQKLARRLGIRRVGQGIRG